MIWCILLIVPTTVTWHFCRNIHRENISPVSTIAPETVTQDAAEPEQRFINHTVKTGETFGNIVASHGIADKDALTWYRHLLSLGLSAIYPGDSLVFAINPDSSIEKISLLNRLQCWYHMTIDDIRIKAEKKPVATSKHVCIARGTLVTSLSEAMYDIGVGDALTAKLTDIFAWDINFFIDPQKGDSFEVIFEKKYADGRYIGYGNIIAAKYINKGKVFYALAMKDGENNLNYFDRKGQSVQKQFLKAPLRYRRISSGYSYNRKHPVLGIVRPHLGIDYAAPTGTPVYAAADGIVSFAGKKGGYGNHIRIRHGASYETYYGHLHSFAKGIRRGTRVKQGQYIGTVGSTGLSTGPHLDYRMKTGPRFVNPLTISVPPKDGVARKDRQRFVQLRRKYLSLLKYRCPGRNGCFVVSIFTNERHAEHETKIFVREASSNGSKSNS
ncbi:MAG: peptidoglycan DD-metalloendopeptidase family protein [Chitinivibrionales bacterium]|nr:peptidoglycan DD-metalloendopeptidase family protein [Chitinivibrionales bacterium]